MDTSTSVQKLNPFIFCDNCKLNINRCRYKCLQCHDFDLCENCQNAGSHAATKHVMLYQSIPEYFQNAEVKLKAFEQMGALKCKIKFLVGGKLTATHLFYLDDCTRLSIFRSKCADLLKCPNNSFTITWKDKEGDVITINRSDEFMYAIQDLSNQVITIHHGQQFVLNFRDNKNKLEQVEKLILNFTLHSK